MGFFGTLFKSKEKKLEAQKYKIGMAKTRSGVLSNLKYLLDSSTVINEELFDELEEIFIMADIGVDTVVKFVNHLRSTVDIKDINTPEKFRLNQNYPNPFNPITTLKYDLSQDAFVDLTIYDMLGNIVSTLVNENQNSGSKSVQWDATNDQGDLVSAGVYLYNIQVGNHNQTKKMILLK